MSYRRPLLAGCQLFLLTVGCSATNPYSNWPQEEYCRSRPVEDAQNATPAPLRPDQLSQYPDIKLDQVQVLARHGARAPYYRVYCWDQAPSPIDHTWNCSASAVLSQDIAPPSSRYGHLYQKIYDVPGNILTGTCVVGGLLNLGRRQHRENGKMLFSRYGQQLFNNSLEHLTTSDIYLRSDDEERTLGSGMNLIDGFFSRDSTAATTLLPFPWHTGDYSTDNIIANAKMCPRLTQISDASTQQNPPFHTYLTSQATEATTQALEAIVGTVSWDSILECLMIARCNALPLPPGLTPALFQQTIAQVSKRQYYALTYNNASYSKLAMGPLLATFLARMEARMEMWSSEVSSVTRKGVAFALVVGHDSTLMPMLAALSGSSWDGLWSPYASLLVFELYRHASSTYLVRIVYKGTPLVIPGCPDDLCPYSTLVRLMSFATSPRDCALSLQETPHELPDTSTIHYGIWVEGLIGCGAIGLFLSLSFITWTRCRRRPHPVAEKYQTVSVC